MSTTTTSNTVSAPWLEAMEQHSNKGFLNNLPELSALHQQAVEAFKTQGIPGRKHEEYKYTPMDSFLKGSFALLAPKASVTADDLKDITALASYAAVVVLVNGHFEPSLSNLSNLPTGLTILSLYDAAKGDFHALVKQHLGKHTAIQADAFVAMNTALAQHGIFIHLTKNTVVEKPLLIVNVSSGDAAFACQPRHLMIAEENTQATLVEWFNSVNLNAKAFTNSLTEVILEKNANINNYRIQDEGNLAMQVNTVQVHQAGPSVYNTNTVTLNGAVVRNNLNIVLDAQHCESHLYGLALLSNTQHVDNHTLVDHRMPNCQSNELYKNIVDGKNTAIFNGKIFVRKDAQKTNAFQSNKNILLSDDATVNTKPQLEIYADDVRCSHGTSTGKMDEEAIFYLQARGISKSSARKLMLTAFASDVLDNVHLPELKEYLEHRITQQITA